METKETCESVVLTEEKGQGALTDSKRSVHDSDSHLSKAPFSKPKAVHKPGDSCNIDVTATSYLELESTPTSQGMDGEKQAD